MALIVEDGSNVTGSESYISVTDTDLYFNNRGGAAWAAIPTVVEKEQSLRNATQYMTAVYTARWKGCRLYLEQLLDWPRDGVVFNGFLLANNIVPYPVKQACAELALRSYTDGVLLADQTQGVVSEKIGPIQIDYDRLSPKRKQYPLITAILQSYLLGNGQDMRLIR